MIHGIIFTICLAFIMIPTMLYQPTHKVLRDQKIYNLCLIFFILLSIISFLFFNDNEMTIEKENSLATFCPIVFLLLYKSFDKIIQKKYNRHMYFYIKFNSIWEDDESDKAQTIDVVFQISLLIIPLAFCYGITYFLNS